MPHPTQAARDYLLPPSDAFWQWWEEGEVLAWAHGKTIAFRQELVAILEALCSNGLPPLGAVALLLSATRDNWREWDTESVTLEEALDTLPDSDYARELLQRVFHGLDQVHQLPPDLRSTLESRIVLAELVFENSPIRVTPAISREVLALLSDGIHEDLIHQLFDDMAAKLLDDLKCLAEGLDRVQEETLRNRRRTGMDSLPIAADESPIPDRIRSLLLDLQEDDELAALASLAQKLLAAITLPRQISQPDELPIGGVSDISNRGTLDRLLLSELANDDLTLSVRLAMNEALYLRRETPRRTQPQRRAVLLEAGIRSWGLPRVFSTAVGLALAAAANPNESAEVYRASGPSLATVDLTSREGLMTHLGSLDLDMHPGPAWELFCERASGDSVASPVLVTTEEVANDPEFRRILNDSPLQHFLMATVNRNGDFHLFTRSPRGIKTLRRAQLDISSLIKSPSEATTLRNGDWVSQLPKIFAVNPFPLRLSHNLIPQCSWKVASVGSFTVTSDRRLLFWESDSDDGALQISDELPSGRLAWADIEADAHGHIFAVVGANGGPLHLLEIRMGDAPSCQIRKVESNSRTFLTMFRNNHALLIVRKTGVDVIELESGRRMFGFNPPNNVRWVRDRFFASNTRGEKISGVRTWFALGFDGHSAQLTKIFDDPHSLNDRQHLASMIERTRIDPASPSTDLEEPSSAKSLGGAKPSSGTPSSEGPIGITSQGDLISIPDRTTTKLNHELQPPVRVIAVSRNGLNVVLQGRAVSHFSQVDVETGSHFRTSRPKSDVLPEFDPLRRESVRIRIRSIGINNQGELALASTRGEALTISLQNQVMTLSHSARFETMFPFEPVTWDTPLGIRLKSADLPGGGRAVLDGRGLIHFRSCNPELPEFTLVLHSRRMPGWAEGGRLWGSDYYTGGKPTISDREAFTTIVLPFVDTLR